MSAVRSTLRALDRLAPPFAAEVAWRLWRHVGAPQQVHPRDAAVHERASRDTVDVDGRAVATYRWGNGERVVLLVHGWRSRASRFSAIVTALESDDTTIVAFDAPANGDSPGRLVTVLDYIAAIDALSRRYGSIDTVIAHSFGVLASAIAIREGVLARRLVGVAGMASADQLVSAFAHQIGLSERATAGLRRRIERRTFPHVTDPWGRFVTSVGDKSEGMPLLLIHDSGDVTVDAEEARRIAEAHGGPVRTVITSGLGHSRILSDSEVITTITDFVTTIKTGDSG